MRRIRPGTAIYSAWCAACLFTALATAGCFNAPGGIPSGTWNYALLINGNRVGSAVISSRTEGANYVTSTELTMKAGSITNISKQIITETKEFVPVKLESYNRIVTGERAQEINTVATFNGRKVELASGGEKSVIETDRDFRLEGHYILSRLIQGGFRKGMTVESWIYEPSIDPEAPVLIKARVAGRENVSIGGKDHAAIRVVEYIAKFKSFDMFLDGSGALLKADLTMLNMNIQLVRE
jgi:hypothetical protein